MHAMLALIQAHPEATIFLTIVVGFAVGRVHIKGIGLGNVAGTLVAGLCIGIALKPEIPDLLRWAFFDLFLFAVGYSIGPQFFASLKKDSIPQVLLSVVVSATGLGAVVLAAWFLHLDPGSTGGLTSGALSQSAALGTALGAIHEMPVSEEARRALMANAPLADAVTYIFGEVGLMLFVSALAPRWLGIDLKADAKALEAELGVEAQDESGLGASSFFTPDLALRAYRVGEGLSGASVQDIEARFAHARLMVRRVLRNGQPLPQEPGTVVQAGDVLAVMANRRELIRIEGKLGDEVAESGALDVSIATLQAVIADRRFDGRTLGELGREYGRGVFVHELRRNGTLLPVAPRTRLARGDVVDLVGAPEELQRLAELLGHRQRESSSMDLVILAGGIVVGTLLGSLQWYVGKVPLGLGATGAILVVGLVAGWASARFRSVPVIPEAAQKMLQDVGLLVFVAVVGLIAGPHAVAAIREQGLLHFAQIFGAGVFVTLAGPVVGLIFGTYVLKMRASLLLAGLCGAQTCIAAINALKERAGTNAVALGFTVPYAISNVLLTVWGALVVGLAQLWWKP